MGTKNLTLCLFLYFLGVLSSLSVLVLLRDNLLCSIFLFCVKFLFMGVVFWWSIFELFKGVVLVMMCCLGCLICFYV